MPRQVGHEYALNIQRANAGWALGFLLRQARKIGPHSGIVAVVPAMRAIAAAKGGMYRGRRYSIEQREAIDALLKTLGIDAHVDVLVNKSTAEIRALLRELEGAARIIGLRWYTE